MWPVHVLFIFYFCSIKLKSKHFKDIVKLKGSTWTSMKMERQVFFKGWASGIFASCDDDYACLAWCDHVQERVSYKGV